VDWQKELGGKHDHAADAAAGNPFALFSKLMNPPEYKIKRSTIAVVHIDGAIIDGESTSGGLMGGSGVGSRTIRRTLSDLEDNKLVKGVVLRIDSPGGSAIASEVIWQGVKRLGKSKPVWISIGNMAASGGYYIAVAGDKVYLNNSSIVGSIGVVGGKFALGGLMEKLHINTVSRSRGPRAAMESMANPWNESDRKLVRQKMEDTYKLFTSRVSQGRAGIDLAKTAEGRLFVGQDAVNLKMADKVGTLADTVGDMATELKLASGSFDVMDFPEPMSFADMIENLAGSFGAGAAAPAGQFGASRTIVTSTLAEAARQVLGDQVYLQARDTMGAAMQLRREKVLLVTPSVLIFR
jgi:protease-4